MLSDMDFDGAFIRPIITRGGTTAMPASRSQLEVDLTPPTIPTEESAVTHSVAATALITVNCMPSLCQLAARGAVLKCTTARLAADCRHAMHFRAAETRSTCGRPRNNGLRHLRAPIPCAIRH